MFKNNRKDRIGQLTEKVSIYKEAPVKDSWGATEIKRTEIVKDRWAKVEMTSMDEGPEDDKILMTQTITVTMRFVDCEEDYLIEYNGNFYNIFFINPVQRKSYVILKASLIFEPDEAE